ncbi:MAG: radical SAM protein [Candidatus Bathyarchaeota archaeon]|nr:radical SAM protein [Candidatus Bathyarchaeota archaeon]
MIKKYILKIIESFSSLIGSFLWRPYLISFWNTVEDYIPTLPRNILKNTMLFIMKSNAKDMQQLKEILEKQIMILAIDVVNICNANCWFCAYRYQNRPKRLISKELFEYAIQQFAGSGGGILDLTPVVGDPLIDKDLVNKIKYAKRMSEIKDIFIFTNLIALNNFNPTDLLLSGLDEINISTCIGSREMYKRVFGVDRYDSVKQNLENLLRENQRLGDRVKIKIHIKGEKPYRKIISSTDYQRILNPYGRNIAHIEEKFDNWTGILKESLENNAFKKTKPMTEPCGELYNGVVVFSNGDVGICYRRDLEAKLVIGNIYECSLEKIWKGKSLRLIRENWVKGYIPLICRKCSCYTSLSDFMVLNKLKILSVEHR